MSKDRARRRQLREREAAERAAARTVAAERAARRRERRTAWARRFSWLTPGRRTGQQTGILARRRRTRLNLVFAFLLLVQVIVWVVRPDWQARLGALVISLLAFPVIAAFAL